MSTERIPNTEQGVRIRQGSTYDTADTNPLGVACCPRYVEIESDPWAGGYCKLKAGHRGECSLFFEGELRCVCESQL